MTATQSLLIWLVAYLVVIVALSMTRPRYLPGRLIYLLRAFFPSWKFFEDSGFAPTLFYRTSIGNTEFGPWQTCLDQPRRTLRSIFVNPDGNFALACHSLLQQLTTDIDDWDEKGSKPIDDLVSYQLVKNLVLFQIRKRTKNQKALRYQFKLCADYLSTNHSSDDILISPIYDEHL